MLIEYHSLPLACPQSLFPILHCPHYLQLQNPAKANKNWSDFHVLSHAIEQIPVLYFLAEFAVYTEKQELFICI